MTAPNQVHVAVYWDFENMHASALNARFGPDAYREARFGKQDAVLNVATIMEYVNGLGSVNINKAFANWAFLHSYSGALQRSAIDLIQLFPRGGHAKNGADIRMAIEVIEDLASHPQIDVVVVVGGDSDYIAVAQKVRSRGKQIIGIGVRESTNPYWVGSCNEFKFYDTLLHRSSVPVQDGRSLPASEAPDVEEARPLLLKALGQIMAASGSDTVVQAAIKPIMLRLEPSFDESDYGFASFTKFLKAFPKLLSISPQPTGDNLVKIIGLQECPSSEAAKEELHEDSYRMILRRQDLRLPSSGLILAGCAAAQTLIEENVGFASMDDFRGRLGARLKEAGHDFDPVEINKFKALLFKVHAFQPYDHESGRFLAFSDRYRTQSDLIQGILSIVFRRLAGNLPSETIDAKKVAELILGDPARSEEVLAVVEAGKAEPGAGQDDEAVR